MNKRNKNILFKKLNRFISKYYKNQLIKGGIFTLSAFITFFLFFSIIEYFSHTSSLFRESLFWSYIVINLIIFWRLVLIPSLHLFRYGKTLGYQEASKIIGNHFKEIDDKLINIIQLNQLTDQENSLIQASIDQKINEIKPFVFSEVINFKENIHYLKWVILPLCIISCFLILQPKILIEGSARILNYNKKYIPSAPFNFNLNESSLKAKQYEDFNLILKMKGGEVPNNVFIEIGGKKLRMSKKNVNNHSHLFKHVSKDVKFRFYANGFYSKKYTLICMKKPSLLNFTAILNYPEYTNLSKKRGNVFSHISVPEGTQIQWDFHLKNVDRVSFSANNNAKTKKVENNKESFYQKITEDINYNLILSNKFISDTLVSNIKCIKDNFPEFTHYEYHLDSLENVFYFEGAVSDDYKITKLDFHYSVKKLDSNTNFYETIQIPKESYARFNHKLDLSPLSLSPSDEILFYFKVWDNDGINGKKFTISDKISYTELSMKDLKQKKDEENHQIKISLDNSMDMAREIRKNINDIKKDLLEKKEIGWEEKQKIKHLINQQKSLQQIIKQNNNRNKKKNLLQEKINPSILEKQIQLEKLMNEVLDEEAKKMIEEMEKLLEEIDKDKIKKMIDNMEEENIDLEQELDRHLELFKQLEFEQKLEETINKINDLKNKQEKLKKETQEKKSISKDLEKKQENLQKELTEVKEDLEKLKKQNQELEKKNDLPDTKENEEKAESSMKESKKSLNEKNKNKSVKQQEEVIQELKDMSVKLNELNSACTADQPMENIETLRQILDNLITLSFDQEELMNDIKSSGKNSNIKSHIQSQKKLADDSQIIEDSLIALSKRVVQMESIITKEINSINRNMEEALRLLENRTINKGVGKQQFVMTSTNNLALILSETLKQMQMQMSNTMPGSQQCNKPGNSNKPSLSELKKMQKKLMNNLKNMKGNKGEKQDGKPNDAGSKAIMQMAKKQAKIRQELEELRNEIGGKGNKGNIDKIIEEMEENEIDILNNRITQETIMRQKDIVTRLLEEENATREKEEEDEKRESIEWKMDMKNINNNDVKYYKKTEDQKELITTKPVQLLPYWKKQWHQYLQNLIQKE